MGSKVFAGAARQGGARAVVGREQMFHAQRGGGHVWLALLLAAMLGTSRSTPIAGVGHAASPQKEFVVTVLLASGSMAIIVATLGLLWGLL